MKSFKILMIGLICTLLSFQSIGQDLFLKLGNRYYENGQYEKAINLYKRVLTRDNIFQAKENLADSYRRINNYRQAEYWYNLVTQSSKAKPISMFHYGQMLQFNKKYAEAKKVYLKFGETDPRGIEYARKLDDIKELQKPRSGIQVRPEMINSSFSESEPSYYKNGLVYASNKPAKASNPIFEFFKSVRLSQDLYFSKINEREALLSPTILEGIINSPAQEGQATFTSDENLIYYSYTLAPLIPNASPLMGIRSALRNGVNWEAVKEFPLNSVSYSIGHPSLSSDNNTMYFISDMSGGYGGYDIYKSDYVNGSWTSAENLGSKINTAGDELHPFIHNSGRLFFSSNGHFGLGGYDIFYADGTSSSWSEVTNAGAPINSISDETSFILNKNGDLGYLSADRLNGYGKSDIYKVSLSSPLPSPRMSTNPNNNPIVSTPKKKTKPKRNTQITLPIG